MNDKLFYNVVFPFEHEFVKEFVITRWHKKIGEKVAKGEPLYDIENDYFEIEITSPYSGILIEILAAEKAPASIDTILARIESV